MQPSNGEEDTPPRVLTEADRFLADAYSHDMVACLDDQCSFCAVRLCSYDDPLHLQPDGCPSCRSRIDLGYSKPIVSHPRNINSMNEKKAHETLSYYKNRYP